MEIPSVTELSELRPRAIVGLAVRCAARVRPLYQHDSPASVDLPLRLAREYAEGTSTHEVSEYGAAAKGAAIAAHAATRAARLVDRPHAERLIAAAEAANAARLACETVLAAIAAEAEGAGNHAATAAAANAARTALYEISAASAVGAPDANYEAIRADAQLLSQLESDAVNLDDSGPLGPLWSERSPIWFAP
ncbi:MAG: hypothetical protein KDA60_07570 [Planctomycetales bacterium]|nr:hypothetical protein [Planctomycetales bacterium]